ncbi:histidyl-tRNA synthetase [Blastocystis sp. ATCC 50177/Nand II]|uniref:histidine--tRNA ligase n=1 Tax=Blastocystis sp. subtype 1 (strain ATCC 50177 / NandII) TaxID=478820 RepID=A0A196SKQ5_BLAHN|nr:histidyl-tRNA synthetase [Blastocystis sp. ATCC 50177/Nand II]
MLPFIRRCFSSLAPVKGMKDMVGTDAWRYSLVISIMSHQCELHGFERIETPVVEREDLFSRGVGADSDIVSKEWEMYTFLDKSDRRLCLRPEFTSSVLRAVLNDKKMAARTSSVYYYGSAYRYERPQHGRYREFHQFGGEIIHADPVIHDVDVILLCCSILKELGLSNATTLHLNSLGSAESMVEYRKVLSEYLEKHLSSLSKESQNRFQRGSILRILDSKEDCDWAIIQNAPSIINSLSSESRDRLERVKEALQSMAIPFVVDPFLVRGLDYYDNVVFEFTSELGAVIGGGCYSSLAKSIGVNRSIPCIGFAAGIERCLELCSLPVPSEFKGVGVVVLGDENNGEVIKAALQVANMLREKDQKAVLCRGLGSVKRAMKEVVSQNLRYAVMMGTNELPLLKQSRILVKDMSSREQKEVSIDDFVHSYQSYPCLLGQPSRLQK